MNEGPSLSSRLILEHRVFFVLIIDDGLLVAVRAAGRRDDQKLEGMYDVHRRWNRLPTVIFNNTIIRFNRIFAPYELIVSILLNFPLGYPCVRSFESKL